MLLNITRRRAQGDEGIALVVAIAIVALAVSMTATMLVLTLRETRDTGHNRQRAEAVSTAEGAVDRTLATVQSAAPASLPCGTSTVTNTQSKPDTMTIATTVTYYDAAGNTRSCSEIQNPSSGIVATGALVRSTATSQRLGNALPAVRTMESYLRLTPAYAQGLDKAIYGYAAVTFSNQADIYGSGASPDADIYTNGNFACANNEHFHGSVYAQGSIALANQCVIDVNAWAKIGYTMSNAQATVSGDVMVSQGAAAITNGTISGKVKAVSVVPSTWCTANPGKCVTGAGVVSDPPVQNFPQLSWNATTQAAWEAQGFTVVTPTGSYASCSGTTNGPGQWIVDNGNTLTGPTILRTTCPVIIANPNNNAACGNKTVCLNNNLAVFADGGIFISDTLRITSTTTATRNLYLIQPYNAAASPCTTMGINLDNQVTVDGTVNELLYSPCTVRKANNTDHYGQIYAGGTAQVENQLTMYYRPLPVWGVNGSTNKVNSYALDILYKRERLN